MTNTGVYHSTTRIFPNLNQLMKVPTSEKTSCNVSSVFPPFMYEYIVIIVTGMVIRKTETIHTHDQNYCYQYQILGTIHGNGRPVIIILIKHEPENLCT